MIPNATIVRNRGTIYALCDVCGMDVLWPSWCKCSPKRIYSTWDLEDEDIRKVSD